MPVFVELSKKIRRHKEAIIATVRHGLSNARIESMNNKIKVMIRKAYGFRKLFN
ncbi:transposase [Holdemanella biformis]|uniref:transposase n=1 Tax=Holdemanella biformis TaxID=1735 RepID=UPI003AB3D4D4